MSLSTNSWYTLESTASHSTRSMQWCTQEIVCYSDINVTSINAQWQLARLDSDDGTIFTLRNRGKGPDSAMAVSAPSNETWPGFAIWERNDPAQQWLLSKVVTDSTVAWLITNVANGTGFELAEQGGANMHMVPSMPAVTTASSQQWIATEVEDINDPVWSAPASSSTTVTSSIKTATSVPSLRPPVADYHTSLKPGAIAGILVGAIAFIVAIILAFFTVRSARRRRRKVYIGSVYGVATRKHIGE